MKSFIIVLCIVLTCSCNKSQTEKQTKPSCGCDTDSVINVCVDSTGWLGYDSLHKQYSISDTIQYNFLNIYWICNPDIKDIASIPVPNNKPVEVYYSGKVRLRCPDSLLTIPEVFLYNISIDSLSKK